MRLLHLITNFEKLAGAEQALINLVGSGLACENAIVALRSDALRGRQLHPDSCQVHSLGLPQVAPLQAWRKLSAIAKDYRPDVVIGWMYHGNFAASLLRFGAMRSCPVVWTVHHALNDFAAESRSTKIAIAGSALVSRNVDAIVYVSARARDQHRKLFGNNKRSFVIPNAVQTATQKIVPSGPRTAHLPGRTIGFAARYHPTKDFATFIRTVRQVHARDPSVRFLACGEGTSLANTELAELARTEGLQSGEIEWLGPCTDMNSFYAEIDALLLTSRAEGFGMVLAEALAHGVPCVSTDVGAAREIIGNAGQIFPIGDANAAAAALLAELNRSDSERQARSNDAIRRIAANFSSEAVREKYSALLKQLISARAS